MTQRSLTPRRLAAPAALTACALTVCLGATALPAAPVAAADTTPARVGEYAANQSGDFRNVLPPGENGLVNATDLVAYQLTGAVPEHFDDQQPLYNGIIAAADTLTDAQVGDYFKDASFGVQTDDIAATSTPREGVTIIRDATYGVPHVYGVTRADTMFGAGYANAADRLFLMDVLRHTGRASLSSFIGGSQANRAMDAAQWRFAPYTDEELQAQIDRAPQMYGEEGAQLAADAQAYVDGINAYIDAAGSDPTLMPSEYAALGTTPDAWTTADLAAEASLIGGIFGRGGGAELQSAQVLQAFEKRFGRRAGRAAWQDFRGRENPEAPTTVLGTQFPYETADAFATRGLAMPDPGSVTLDPTVTEPPPRAVRRSTSTSPYDGLARELRDLIVHGGHASNWELVSGEHTETGHPLGVLGPQVGFYLPQVLMEMDLHGPGVDARGATFPGVGLFVLLGHGRDYAWSATTAYADNTDTFAEVLCQDDVHYRYRGECLPMDALVRENSWTPNAVDSTPPGSETLTSYRTVHGIVQAYGTVGGRKVAFVAARSTYGHEPDSALFFSRMNNPDVMTGPGAFRAAVKQMNFGFNWAYLDSEHIAYQLAGWYPRRARGTSPDFPVLGTGRFDWRGFDPATHLASWLPQRRVPHAVDQDYLVSWNNKQAPGWGAADDKYGFSSLYRSQLISDKVRADIAGGRKISLAELVQSTVLSGTQDLRGVKLLPWLLRGVGRPDDERLAAAVASLRSWLRDGAHRRDVDGDGDGVYEHDDAVTLLDAWWPLTLEAEFRPVLGKAAFTALRTINGYGDPGRGEPDAPAFSDGWYGYQYTDLRTVLGAHPPRDAFTRAYCGRGDRAACRAMLRATLTQALDVPRADLYGYGDCADDPQASCWDAIRSINASAAGIDPQPFQNRPTFQQTVSITAPLG